MIARLVLSALALVLLVAAQASNLPQGPPRRPQMPRTTSARTPADLVILNAKIHTAGPSPKAQAMAVLNGRIVAIGSNQKVAPYMGPSTVVWDIPGRAVLPGLIDSHGHMLGLGEKVVTLDLVGTRSYEEIVQKCLRRAAELPKGEWLIGRGWDQNDWVNQAMPTHEALSAAIPDRPVALERIDGHALLVNRVALQRAGITRRTPNPTGGIIERNARGEATGVLVDNAATLVESKIPDPGPAERERRLAAAMRTCARAGLTMVHDAGISRATLRAYKSLLAKNQFPIRIYAMAASGDSLAEDLLQHGRQLDERLTVRAIKAVYDGALGSRGALLSDPYSDRPGHRGVERITVDALARLSARAREAGIQVRVHAIGDLANRRTLDAFERAFERRGRPDLRWAIEHCQVVQPEDVRRFARLGIVASMQPTHATSDGPWAEERLGRRRVSWSYSWRTFLRSGVRLAGGSDFPVESERPMLGLYAAVTRRDRDGKLPAAGWRPEEKLDRTQALRAFTIAGAHLAFQERDLGSLEVNKLADFVVVDPDPLEGRPEILPNALIMKTVVGGRVVWDAENP